MAALYKGGGAATWRRGQGAAAESGSDSGVRVGGGGRARTQEAAAAMGGWAGLFGWALGPVGRGSFFLKKHSADLEKS